MHLRIGVLFHSRIVSERPRTFRKLDMADLWMFPMVHWPEFGQHVIALRETEYAKKWWIVQSRRFRVKREALRFRLGVFHIDIRALRG